MKQEPRTESVQLSPVPFPPGMEKDLEGVEYLLETGEVLYSCPTAPDYFVSDNRLADGPLTTPHIYRAVTREDGLVFCRDDTANIPSPYEMQGPELPIQQEGVPYGLFHPRIEPGYILKNGIALLECEKDAYGNYKGGAGIDGMFLQTGQLFAPVKDEGGTLLSFREVQERPELRENYLRIAELETEQNYNQIDGIINNEPPRVNQEYVILESVEVGNKEFVLAENPRAPQPFVTWMRNMDNDRERGGENFFWGYYFTDRDAAQKNFVSRVEDEREYLAQHSPSLLERRKRGQAEVAKRPGRDAPEKPRGETER